MELRDRCAFLFRMDQMDDLNNESYKPHLKTPMTDVKSLGVSGTKLVKINSNLVWLHFVRMYKASVSPLSFELTVLEVMFSTQLYPMAAKERDTYTFSEYTRGGSIFTSAASPHMLTFASFFTYTS